MENIKSLSASSDSDATSHGDVQPMHIRVRMLLSLLEARVKEAGRYSAVRRSGKYVNRNIARLKECYRTNVFDIYFPRRQGHVLTNDDATSKGVEGKQAVDASTGEYGNEIQHNYHMMQDVTILPGSLQPDSIVYRGKQGGGVLTMEGMRRGSLMAPIVKGTRRK